MSIDYVSLKNELNNDPVSMGYSTYLGAGNEAGVCDLINATSGVGASNKVVPLPILTVLQFASSRGIRTNIEDVSKASGVEYRGLRSLCLGFIDMVWGVGVNRVFDITDPAISGAGGFLDSFVMGGVMSSQDKDDLMGLGTYPSSRAEVLFGNGVVIRGQDVSFALRGTK